MKLTSKNNGVRVHRFTNTQIIASITFALFILGSLNPLNIFAHHQSDDENAIVRQQALLALQDVLEEAKGYDDSVLRVRVKVQIADVLWPIEIERARDLIITAFDEIPTMEAEPSVRYKLRSEAIGVARKYDPQLANYLIEQLKSGDGNEKSEILNRETIEHITDRGAIYLDSARELLRGGNQEQAITFARRSLSEGRSSGLLSFLHNLRKQDEAAANKLFLDSVDTIQKISSDPNDILLLGMYLFSQNDRIVFANINGQLIVSKGVDFSTASPPPITLSQPYLQAAIVVLSRFSAMPGQVGSIQLKRFALQQLLPLFDRYLPNVSVAMRTELGHLDTLSSTIPLPQAETAGGNTKDSLSSNLTITELIDNIERVTGVRERDALYFEAALGALGRKDFEKARALVSKINEVKLRQETIELIAFHSARKAIEQGDLGEAEKIANSKLSQDRSALIYQKLAQERLKRQEIAEANLLINQASIQASKIEDCVQRIKVYIYLAAGIADQDTLRAYEFIEVASKDIDSCELFDLNNNRITFKIPKPNGAIYEQGYSSGVSLLSVVPPLAQADIYRVISLARSIQKLEPRAFTIITACRTALNSNKKTDRQLKEEDNPKKPRSK